MTRPPSDHGPQPELTDGVIVLRPWRDEDVEPARLGHDEEIAYWLGSADVTPSTEQCQDRVRRYREGHREYPSIVGFAVEHDGSLVGGVEIHDVGDQVGQLRWTLYAGHRGQGYATRAVRLLVDYAISELGLTRIEARVDPDNERSLRVATRSGLRREGVVRGRGDRSGATGHVLLARLADDPPISEPESFRGLLNSFLPRKRAISQMLVRDESGRVLLCQLTYKQDWDLPGGVVEVGESPQLAVAREVEEELGLQVKAGPLVLTDWLPSWSGWDDALCLVFDGGVLDASVLDQVVLQPREIRSARFCALDEVHTRCADFTARRVESALANLSGTSDTRGGSGGSGGPSYTESGR